MARVTVETHACDKCGRKLKTHQNTLNIVTSLREGGYWSRLHVSVTHRHGVNNDGREEKAKLCKSCAIKLLEDALARVRKGERATEGSEAVEEGKW